MLILFLFSVFGPYRFSVEKLFSNNSSSCVWFHVFAGNDVKFDVFEAGLVSHRGCKCCESSDVCLCSLSKFSFPLFVYYALLGRLHQIGVLLSFQASSAVLECCLFGFIMLFLVIVFIVL